nr:hypothetical protein Iba_chr06cCG5320 [Ipomoea batatas]
MVFTILITVTTHRRCALQNKAFHHHLGYYHYNHNIIIKYTRRKNPATQPQTRPESPPLLEKNPLSRS